MPLFDPETGAVLDRDALRSLQFRAGGFTRPATRIVDGKKVSEVLHDDDGTRGGLQIEHGNGQQDANVFSRAPNVGHVTLAQ